MHLDSNAKYWVSFFCLWPVELDHWFAMYVLLDRREQESGGQKNVCSWNITTSRQIQLFTNISPRCETLAIEFVQEKVTLAHTGVLLTISVGGRAHANTEHTALVCKFQADCFYSNLADEKFNFCLERIFGTYKRTFVESMRWYF